MHTFLALARRFLRRDDGPSAVEYALVLALIVVVCVVSITALGSRVTKTFKKHKSADAGWLSPIHGGLCSVDRQKNSFDFELQASDALG